MVPLGFSMAYLLLCDVVFKSLTQWSPMQGPRAHGRSQAPLKVPARHALKEYDRSK